MFTLLFFSENILAVCSTRINHKGTNAGLFASKFLPRYTIVNVKKDFTFETNQTH